MMEVRRLKPRFLRILAPPASVIAAGKRDLTVGKDTCCLKTRLR
jgi:hypothetical protein